MNKASRIGIVAALAVVIAVTIAMKQNKKSGVSAESTLAVEASATAPAGAMTDAADLPTLLDLGSTQCFNCKRLGAILDVMKKEYAGRMKIEFIDVRENREAVQLYGIRIIPTLIFLDASGQELYRYDQGVMSKEDILAKWKELGVDVESMPASS
jgi:thioredoxin 1